MIQLKSRHTNFIDDKSARRKWENIDTRVIKLVKDATQPVFRYSFYSEKLNQKIFMKNGTETGSWIN